jgi:hypothetical protein
MVVLLGAILVVPVRATLLVGWEERIPLFEVRIWGMSLRRRRPPALLRRLVNRLLDRFLRAFPSRSSEKRREGAPAPVRRADPVRLAWWALVALGRFLSHFTRRLEIRLGGMDPALLGGSTGFLGGIAAALGIERFSWIPEFQPGPLRFRLRWTVSISVLGILLWVGRSASLFPRKSGGTGLLPSAP